MSSYIRLPSKYKYLGIPAEDASLISPTSDNMGARLEGVASLLSGEESGKQVTDIKMNQLVKIVPKIPINAGKYTVHVGFNPELAEVGAVSCNPICGNGSEVSLVIKAYKNFRLEDLGYIFQIYVID